MKRQLLGILICLIIITSLFILSSPFSSGKKVTKETTITIKKIDDEKLSIEADQGEINYTWKILDNINNLTVVFKLSYNEDLVRYHSGTKDSGKIEVSEKKEGKYIFEWINNNNINITLSVKIRYEKTEIEEGKGCYSSIIALSSIFIGLIISIAFFSNKKKFERF